MGVAFGATHPHRLRCLVGTGRLKYRNLSDLPPADTAGEIREAVASGDVRQELEHLIAVENDRFPPPIDANVRAGDPLTFALLTLS